MSKKIKFVITLWILLILLNIAVSIVICIFKKYVITFSENTKVLTIKAKQVFFFK